MESPDIDTTPIVRHSQGEKEIKKEKKEKKEKKQKNAGPRGERGNQMDFHSFRGEMEKLFEKFSSKVSDFAEPWLYSAWRTSGSSALKMDVVESSSGFTVFVDIPGIPKEYIKISVEGNHVLMIEAERTPERKEDDQETWHVKERNFGKFWRSVVLPSNVDFKTADAKYENAVLTLTFPKTEEAIQKPHTTIEIR